MKTFLLAATAALVLASTSTFAATKSYFSVISASAVADQPTVFLTFAREDGTPLTASTYGLDVGLRQSSSLDVTYEINAGGQLTGAP